MRGPEERGTWHYLDDLWHGDGVVAVQDEQVVGVLLWRSPKFEEYWPIFLVWTHPEYRRRGIATDLARSAAAERPLRHSDHRTASAEEWSKKTGLLRPPMAVAASDLGESGEWVAKLAGERLGLRSVDAAGCDE
jgi:GNAT superfamily N-acetyltransferase